jgi:hypothetical protein
MSNFMFMVPCILILYTCVQRDATISSIYSLFHCKITLHVSGAFTPIIMSTGNCSRRPLVQVICRNRQEGAASNPLKGIQVRLRPHSTTAKLRTCRVVTSAVQ